MRQVDIARFLKRRGRGNFSVHRGMLPEAKSEEMPDQLRQILAQTQAMQQQEQPSMGASIGSAIGQGMGALGSRMGTDSAKLPAGSLQDRLQDENDVRRHIEGNEGEMLQLPATRDITKKRLAMKEGNPLAQTRMEIERRETKDFSKGGADYDQDHDWKDVLRSLGIGALRGLANADPRQSLGSMLGGGLGGAIGGGIGGAVDPNTDEKLSNQIALDREYGKYDRQLGRANAEIGLAGRQAQIDNIYADNELNQERLEGIREEQAAKRREVSLGRLTRLKHFDPSNKAHAKLAEDAGLDIAELQGWDDRDPKTKQVAGVTYQYDHATKSFAPSNIPVDESKTLTDYKVQMPNGETRTYKVAQKDAANFATQMLALGARLAQQESQFTRRLALDEKKFSQAQSEFQQMMTLRKEAEARQDKEGLARIDSMIESAWQRAMAGLQDGELTQDQYNMLGGIINRIEAQRGLR